MRRQIESAIDDRLDALGSLTPQPLSLNKLKERGASVVGLDVFVRALSALAPRQRGCVRPFTHILFLPASGRSRVVFQLEQDILYLSPGQKRKDAVLTVKNADFVN